MAALTSQSVVRADKYKLGSRVVIERPDFPVYRRMAVGTFGSQACVMSIVFGMAVDTLLGCVMKSRRFMAVFANYFIVAADEREHGKVVIESDVAAPVDFCVTRCAVLAKLQLVRFVSNVAAVAICGR